MSLAIVAFGVNHAMRCLHCDQELPESLFKDWERSDAAGSSRFNCPACGAEHVRREIGRTPSGTPQHSIRLWGHLSAIRRKKDGKKKETPPPTV